MTDLPPPAISALLAELWIAFSASLPRRVAPLEQAAAALASGELDPGVRERAVCEAHKLTGSLGTFGKREAAACARQMEALLTNSAAAEPAVMAAQLRDFIRAISAQVNLPEKGERT